MPNINLGGISLPASGSGSGSTGTTTFRELKECAARVVKGQAHDPVLATAAEGIQYAIKTSNMKHNFRFLRKTDTDITLVAADTTYGVASDFFGAHVVQLVDATDSKPRYTLRYEPWGAFHNVIQRQTDTGRPTIWTQRNVFADGEIRVYPEPDAGAVSDYKLRINYFRRLPIPTADDDVIAAPLGIDPVLCMFGRAWVLETHDAKNSRKIERHWAFYERLLGDFKASTNRENDEMLQFRLAVDARDALDTDLYIKVS